MSHKNRVKFPVCPNCQYTFPEEVNNYCPNCGQENHDLNLPASHLFLELLENTLHFDTKFFRSLKYLLFYPGKLTAEFIANRRMSYVPPFRLYIFISFIFFLIPSPNKDAGKEAVKTNKTETETQKIVNRNYTFKDGSFEIDTTAAPPAKTKGPNIAIIDYKLDSTEQRILENNPSTKILDSILTVKGRHPSFFNRFTLKRAAKYSKYSKEERDQKIVKAISFMMFLLMPLFALLLKGFYLRRHRHYIEHLIHSIHIHCFVFILLTFNILRNYIYAGKWIIFIVILLPAIYLFFSLKKVYKQGTLKTAIKTILLSAIYSLILLIFIIISMVLGTVFL